MTNVEKIAITGVGANDFGGFSFNKQKIKIPEFIATGSVGEDEKFVVASIGTGTAFIKNEKGEITHLGGTGVGGGTLINLSKKINPNITFEDINIERCSIDFNKAKITTNGTEIKDIKNSKNR